MPSCVDNLSVYISFIFIVIHTAWEDSENTTKGVIPETLITSKALYLGPRSHFPLLCA